MYLVVCCFCCFTFGFFFFLFFFGLVKIKTISIVYCINIFKSCTTTSPTLIYSFFNLFIYFFKKRGKSVNSRDFCYFPLVFPLVKRRNEVVWGGPSVLHTCTTENMKAETRIPLPHPPHLPHPHRTHHLENQTSRGALERHHLPPPPSKMAI